MYTWNFFQNYYTGEEKHISSVQEAKEGEYVVLAHDNFAQMSDLYVIEKTKDSYYMLLVPSNEEEISMSFIYRIITSIDSKNRETVMMPISGMVRDISVLEKTDISGPRNPVEELINRKGDTFFRDLNIPYPSIYLDGGVKYADSEIIYERNSNYIKISVTTVILILILALLYRQQERRVQQDIEIFLESSKTKKES